VYEPNFTLNIFRTASGLSELIWLYSSSSQHEAIHGNSIVCQALKKTISYRYFYGIDKLMTGKQRFLMRKDLTQGP